MAEWSELITPDLLGECSFGVGIICGVLMLMFADVLNYARDYLRDKRKVAKNKGGEK